MSDLLTSALEYAKTTNELRGERRRTPQDNGLLTIACPWPKHGTNLGTLARTADALNARIAIPPTANAAKALCKGNTIGTHNVNIEHIHDTKTWLQQQLHRIVAVELAHNATPLRDLKPGPACIILGHENTGIPQWMLEQADTIVEIPMTGVGNSLNVAVAGSLVAYKAAGLV